MPETENQDATSIRIVALAVGSLLVAAPFATGQVERQERRLPPGVSQLKLAAPLEMSGVGRPAVLHESLIGAVGRRQVIVRLKTPAVGKLNEVPLADLGYDLAGARFARRHKILDEQRGFLDRCRRAAPAAEVLTEAQTVLNALILDVDASALPALAQDPAVERIAPVANYQMDLSETVPYIGAAAVQAKGYNGKGIRVAVLDSGIDYTHAALGGSGNPADYAANDPTFVEPGTFPTAKVVGGYDFVGGDWTGGAGGGPPPPPTPPPGPAPPRSRPAGQGLRRRSRHPRRPHHRRRGRRRPRRRPLRGEGVFFDLDRLFGNGADPGHGVRRRPQRRR
jgi:minor extracellular serine protease Vpr